jgi:hypothetical protein
MISVENFKNHLHWVHRMTVDFVEAVPDDKWDYTPGGGLGPFCRQLRHVVCVRGVYNAALTTKKADFSTIRDHYGGSLARGDLLPALNDIQQRFLAALETVDTNVTIDFGGTAFPFDNFAGEVIQHESIHHGQWSAYAYLGGFPTPRSWRAGWRL